MGRTLVCLVAVTLTLAVGTGSTAHEKTVVTMGTVSAAEHEVVEGYFALGEDLTLVAKPGSSLHTWLTNHIGEQVVLSVRTRPGTLPEAPPGPQGR
jgi:hypothetical protein